MHIAERLNVTAMVMAGSCFLGEHDFSAYSNAKSKKKSMVRRILSLDIEEEEGFINIRICGDGFLYNMVRKIVGTLIEVGLGEIEAKDIPGIIESGVRKETGRMADPWGLYLERIDY